jgi:hypothetical protein
MLYRMKPHAFVVAVAATLTLSGSAMADGAAAVQAMQAARDAAVAMEARDSGVGVSKLETAIALRPDFPQLHLDLAVAQTGAGQADEAVATLRRYAALGFFSAVDKSPEFAALRTRKDFQDVYKLIAANGRPKGAGEVVFSRRAVTGLIEGSAWRGTTGEFLFGDVHGRAVWVREKGGALRRLTPEGDELLGVFGLAVDESTGALWMATAAVPAMRGFTADQAGQTALVEVDLATGATRRTVPVPRGRGSEAISTLTDVAIGPDGAVYVTDEGTPVVWWLPPGGSALERWVESPEFFSLQGIAVLPSGIVLVADQVNGLVSIEPRRRTARWLAPPADTALGDVKSLTVTPAGQVLALQRLEVDEGGESIASVAVVESGHVAMGAPSLGCVGPDGDFYFVGNAGWGRFASGDGQPTAPRQVPVFRTKLPKAKK